MYIFDSQTIKIIDALYKIKALSTISTHKLAKNQIVARQHDESQQAIKAIRREADYILKLIDRCGPGQVEENGGSYQYGTLGNGNRLISQ